MSMSWDFRAREGRKGRPFYDFVGVGAVGGGSSGDFAIGKRVPAVPWKFDARMAAARVAVAGDIAEAALGWTGAVKQRTAEIAWRCG